MQYETEEQQVEAIKEWWAENGRAVILGIVIGVVIIAAWMWWKGNQEKKAVAASDTFSQSIEALESGNHAKVVELLAVAKDDHADTMYGAYTGFAAARSYIEQGNLEEAASTLDWVADNAELDDIVYIANVRLARVKAAIGDAKGGLAVLPKSYPKEFTALIEEARGDLLVAEGNDAEARAAYQTAIDTEQSANPAALQMKFNELASVSGKS